MKKILLLLLATISISSCRITKTAEMIAAKNNSKLTEEQFVKAKFDAVDFLQLTDEQKLQCEKIWKQEKREYLEINMEDNALVGPVIYNSEVAFRKVLTVSQLEDYKAKGNSEAKVMKYFLDDHALSEIKRIYIK